MSLFLRYNRHDSNDQIKCFDFFCLYIFDLYIDPNDQCVLPVYFWSQHQPIRSILLHHSYNIMVCLNNTIYCIKSASNKLS